MKESLHLCMDAMNVENLFHCTWQLGLVSFISLLLSGTKSVSTDSVNGVALNCVCFLGVPHKFHEEFCLYMPFSKWLIIVITFDGVLKISWFFLERVESPNELMLRGHTAPVVACDWMCDGRQLVTGSWDHTALLWDCDTGQTIHTLKGMSLYRYTLAPWDQS